MNFNIDHLPAQTDSASSSPDSDHRFTVQRREGVRLSTVDSGSRGSRENVLLFLHGWACDSANFDAQLEHFEDRYRVIIPNLRGHGPSDAPPEGYALADFADDLRWQLDDFGVKNAIVVGHSMGGNVGLELAARDAGRISGLLMIDSVVFPGRDIRDGLKTAGQRLNLEGLDAALAELAPLLFIAEDDSNLSAEIRRRMTMTPDHVAVSAFRAHITDYDPGVTLANCDIPLGYIAAASPLADLPLMRHLCPHLICAQTFASGHFPQVFVPDQVNAMIERFVTLVEARARA